MQKNDQLPSPNDELTDLKEELKELVNKKEKIERKIARIERNRTKRVKTEDNNSARDTTTATTKPNPTPTITIATATEQSIKNETDLNNHDNSLTTNNNTSSNSATTNPRSGIRSTSTTNQPIKNEENQNNQNNASLTSQHNDDERFEIGAVVTIAESQRKRRIHDATKGEYRKVTINTGRIERITGNQLYLTNKLLRFRIDKKHCTLFLNKEQGGTYCAPFNPCPHT